jgi:cyclopropane-fatty-acyl-phospholipid synthase
MTDITKDEVSAPAKMSGLGSWMLRRITSRLLCGTLTVVTPSGRRISRRTAVDGPDVTVTMHRWRTLRRLLIGGDVGFAEAYIDGDWSTNDLTALLELAALNETVLNEMVNGWPAIRLFNRIKHLRRSNTKTGSKRNIIQHYDLGNAFYQRWLDAGMSYSSALFRRPEMTLEAAQTEKQNRVLELLGVEAGCDVLEIGCGWGGLMARLAQHGCKVTGLTLSPSQRDHAVTTLETAGLADRSEVRLQDYRDVGGLFDRIVSIEMIEAVGEAFWPRYFEQLRARLKPGGAAVLQVITIADERFEGYRRSADFIQRHIFPGGMLPSPQAMHNQVAQAGLQVDLVENFGASYARTLKEWRERFEAAWPEIAAMGFPPHFRRLWNYYLCYCEAGFRTGALDVGMWRLSPA